MVAGLGMLPAGAGAAIGSAINPHVAKASVRAVAELLSCCLLGVLAAKQGILAPSNVAALSKVCVWERVCLSECSCVCFCVCGRGSVTVSVDVYVFVWLHVREIFVYIELVCAHVCMYVYRCA